MFCICAFSFLLLSSYAHAEDSLLSACSKNDLACLQNSCTSFMTATAAGLSEPFNIEPLDPMTIPERTVPACCDDPPTGTITVKNVIVKGLKDIKLDGFELNEADKTVRINTSITLQYESDVVFNYGDKEFSGKMDAKDAQAKVTTSYNYAIEADDKGVRHFKIGPERNICEVVKAPTMTLNSELENALNSDPEVAAGRQKNRDEIDKRRSKFTCDMIDLIFPRFYEAWRKGLGMMPVDTVLKDLS